MKRRLLLSLILLLGILQVVWAGTGGALLDDFEDRDLTTLWGSDWTTYSDVREGGASKVNLGIDARGGFGGKSALRFQYSLQATAAHSWVYCGLKTVFRIPRDVSAYQGIQFAVRSSRAKDKLTMSLTYRGPGNYTNAYEYTFAITKDYQYIAIPFTKFQIGSWFLQYRPQYVPDKPYFTECIEICLEKQGASGENNTIWLDEISFYAGEPAGKISGEIVPPVHEKISGSGETLKKTDALIAVDLDRPFIDPDSHNQGRIRGELFGASLGDAGFPPLEKVLPLNLKIFRFNGGTGYNWRSNKYTGWDGTGHPGLALEDFVAYCRKIGAEPLISVNLLGWMPNDKNNDIVEDCMTAQDAADLVTYLNGVKGLRVRYFQMDNEFEFWHAHYPRYWKAPCSADEYLRRFTSFALAMKKAQAKIGSASDIQIVGPEISSSWQSWKTLNPSDTYGGLGCFVPYFLNECRKIETDRVKNPDGFRILDVLSFHLYPMFRTNGADPYSFIPIPQMMESTQVWWNRRYVNKYDFAQQPVVVIHATIPRFNQWINKYYPGTKLAVTEFGLEADPSIEFDPIVRPIYLADLYGIFAKYGVDYAIQHTLSDKGQLGLLNQYSESRPQYYPFLLYAQNFKGTVLTAESNRSDRLNVYACDDNEGNLVLMVVNKDRKDYQTKIQLSGYPGKAVDNTFYYVFKRYSLTCIKLPKDNAKNQGDVWVYGEEQINAR